MGTSLPGGQPLHSILAFACLALGCAGGGGPNVALVVGNSEYAHAAALQNADNDARIIAATLEGMGWKVSALIDEPKPDFDEAFQAFATEASQATQALFYYAGHGMQIDGRNYLVPIEFDPSHSSLNRDLISLNAALTAVDRSRGQLAVILDACRDNPLAGEFESRLTGGRGLDYVVRVEESSPETVSFGRGLAEVATGARTFIAYATEPGDVALDGTGSNSPFTAALARHMTARNKDIAWILKRVRTDVVRETGGEQVPWDHSALTEAFILHRKKISAPPP